MMQVTIVAADREDAVTLVDPGEPPARLLPQAQAIYDLLRWHPGTDSINATDNRTLVWKVELDRDAIGRADLSEILGALDAIGLIEGVAQDVRHL